jgi:hypothetical protein
MDLFKTTRFGKTGLNASKLAQFFGYGGALLVLWLLAQKAATLISNEDERWNVLKSILVPLATLVVIACGHSLLLLVLGPLISKAVLQIYNWVFIAAIIVSAAWLVGALFTGSASLAPLFGSSGRRRKE